VEPCSPAQRGTPCNRLCCAPAWCALAVLPNPSTPTSGHVTVLIRVPESRLRGNSPERFGRGERLKSPTYPYCSWATKTWPLTRQAVQVDGLAGGSARDVHLLNWRKAATGEPCDAETVTHGSERGGGKRASDGTSPAVYSTIR
jgi:hypothetical protein